MRVTRLVGAFAAGRFINPRLVQSQLYGGMIWGVSFALHEQAVIDQRSGRPMNANLAEYHVPVNADVPSLEARAGSSGKQVDGPGNPTRIQPRIGRDGRIPSTEF
jgi:CO/xanthine dehydrogenase Mo-binding subunit